MQKLQKLDIFSQQFSFFVGQKKKKKTLEGGLYTITAFSLSLGYLIYLLVLFFDNKFLPKITSKIKNQTTLQDIQLNQNVFGFTFSSQGLTLQQLEQSTGKQYLIFKAQFAYISLQKQNYTDLPIIDCPDQSFSGYLCLDFNNMTDIQKTLSVDPTTQAMSQYTLTVQPCTGLPTCASPAEIQNKIIDKDFQFYVKVRIVQFNEQSQKYEQGYQIDLVQFDDNLALQNQYQLTQSITTVNQGFLFQNTSVSKFISGYQKSSLYYSPNNLLQKAGFTGYAQFLFFLQQNQEINHIQYPLITEALAQFMPVVKILFILGIFTRLFSESKIVENLNTLFLKEYYRGTALKLLSSEQEDEQLESNKSNNQNKINQLKKINQNIDKNAIYGINQNSDTKQIQNTSLTADQIIGFQKQIDENEFKNEEKSKFYANFFQFYKQYFFGKIMKQTSQREIIYQKMCSFTKKSIDIFSLYKNMIKVNMAIKLLMSKEQYAALQFCGCEMDQINFEKNSTQFINNQENISNKNQEILDKQQSNQNQIQQTTICKAQDLEEGKHKKIVHKSEEAYSLNQIPVIDSNQTSQRQTNNSYIKQMPKNIECQISLKNNENYSTNCEMLSPSSSNQINNHLQQQEEILTNKHMLHLYLKKFIDRINRNQELTQVDLNIYSSLIGSQPKVG
ncbi:transmembrane protein, putative (macronuclear) [Tetrahymena thermophila SB210]|uniref:Transmembrane protein, putative n=1 Tax=Tetrahymena thermophila (strain SB210) TaxID=312017 RepID=W7XJ72_TETTS|nr:transmembrane protein, putative [Tetrahymena thermophila SB210]EWS75266.1 transmembrane protein, putative [Tetrahymena thermophila SB210]|eukprot:XP_012652257.1 transmembrane protein, putative [Tetrahymena thermophila SB210]